MCFLSCSLDSPAALTVPVPGTLSAANGRHRKVDGHCAAFPPSLHHCLPGALIPCCLHQRELLSWGTQSLHLRLSPQPSCPPASPGTWILGRPCNSHQKSLSGGKCQQNHRAFWLLRVPSSSASSLSSAGSPGRCFLPPPGRWQLHWERIQPRCTWWDISCTRHRFLSVC